MAKPLTLTIVIPVYNEERHLKACLDAIASQTVKPDAVIIVDNNSTDRSVEIAESYPFVEVLHEKKQGIVFARNNGFDAVKSDIIGRIDADTVVPKNWVSKVKDFYQHDYNADKALTGGGYFYNLRAPRFNGWVQSQLAFRVNRFITGFYILWGSNMAMPAKLWKDVKRDVCLRTDIHEDLDLAIHLNNIKYNITYKTGLRVGVYMKRMWDHRGEQREHTAKWPRTLRVHGYKNWWLGSVGNVLIIYVLQPLVVVMELVGRLMGRRLT